MTEKRFTSDYNGDEHLLTHFLDNGKPLTKQEVIELLNALYEEKERWRESWIEEMQDQEVQSNTILELMKENEQLNSRVQYLKRKMDRERNATTKQYEKWEKEALEKINKLEKENAFLTVEVEALGQIKPIKKLPRELTVLKLDDGDVK